MTMNNKLQTIKNKIYELVPRLKEPTFGCEVKIQMDEETSERQFIHYMNGWGDLGIIVDCEDYDVDTIYDVDYVEIIGHPIRLEDVLEATDKVGLRGYENTISQDERHIILCWNWGKTLDEQSEDVWELVGNLLGV